MIGRSLAFIFVCFILTLPASGAELVAGPVEARVLRVIDGDTFEAEALVWPGHRVRVAMRSRCSAERRAAVHAKDALERLIGGRIVTISQVGGGKYYGRVLADATNAEGLPIAETLLRHGMVRAYAGGRRVPFCDNLAEAGAS